MKISREILISENGRKSRDFYGSEGVQYYEENPFFLENPGFRTPPLGQLQWLPSGLSPNIQTMNKT